MGTDWIGRLLTVPSFSRPIIVLSANYSLSYKQLFKAFILCKNYSKCFSYSCLLLKTTVYGKFFYYTYFTDKETKINRSEINCPCSL